MDMCDDCYKCQFNHKGKNCWKYTDLIIKENEYTGGWCNEYVVYWIIFM